MSASKYRPHPHIAARKRQGAVRAEHTGPNARLALLVTGAVGTMWCAYLFGGLALLGLPAALHAGGLSLVMWLSSTFLQLVLLPVIIVGQNVQARAADARAVQTFDDAEAILHEQEHLRELAERTLKRVASLYILILATGPRPADTHSEGNTT